MSAHFINFTKCRFSKFLQPQSSSLLKSTEIDKFPPHFYQYGIKLNLKILNLFYRYGISVFIVPLLVLIFTYTSICREIWKSSNMEFGNRQLQSSQLQRVALPRRAPLISRAKINTVKQTVAVIVTYIVCSTPFIFAQLWATWDPNSYKNPFFDGK